MPDQRRFKPQVGPGNAGSEQRFWEQNKKNEAQREELPVIYDNDLYSEHIRRRDATIISSMVRTPIDFPHIVQLGRMAYHSAFGEQADADGQELSALERFIEGRYASENRGKVRQHLDEKAENFFAQNPEASQEDVEKYLDEITRSEAFHIFEREQLPSFFGTLERWGDNVDMFFGAPRDHEKTNNELITQSVAQVALPVGGAISSLQGVPRALRPLVEIGTPVNSAVTAPGYGAVVGFNAAVPFLMAEGLGREVGFDEAKTPQQVREEINVGLIETHEDDNDPGKAIDLYPQRKEQLEALNETFIPWQEEILTMLAAGAAGAGGMRPPRKPNVNPRKHNEPTSSITSTDDAPEALATSVTQTVKGSVDDVSFAAREFTPIEQSMRTAFGVGPTRGWDVDDGGVARRVRDDTAEITSHGHGQASVAVRSALEFGDLPGNVKVTPINRMVDFRQALQDAGEYEGVMDFIHARTYMSRFHNDKIRPIETELGELRTRADAAWSLGKDNEIKALRQQIAEKEASLATLKAEIDPRWLRALDNPPDGPKARDFIKAHDDIAEGILKSVEADNLLPKRELDMIRAAHDGTYSPIRVDDLAYTTKEGGQVSPRGFRRLAAKVRHHAKRNYDDPILDPDVKSVDLGRVAKNWEPAKNAIDPVDALRISTERFIRAAEQARMRRSWWDKVKNAGDLDKVGKVKTWKRGKVDKTLLTPAEKARVRSEAAKAGRSDPFQGLIEIPLKNDDKGRRFYFQPTREFARLPEALTHEGTRSIFIARSVKNLTAFGYVGALRPLQSIPLAWYDTTTPAAARPRGQTFGLDWLADIGTKAVTGQRMTDAQLSRMQQVPFHNVADTLIGAGVIIPRALQLYMKRNKTRIVQQTMQSIAAESGWMKEMMKIPAYNRWFQAAVDNSVDGFTDSFMRELTKSGAMSADELRRSRRSIIEYNRIMGDIPTKIETAIAPANEAWIQYQMMFNSFRDSVRFHYASVNASRLMDRHGGSWDKVPKAKRDKLVNDARILSGDFQERPGSKWIQMYGSTTPFFNPMLAGAKNVWSRITHDPRVAYTFTTGVVVPHLFHTAYMFNWWDEEAREWAASQPAWQRAANITWIRPDIVIRRAMGEEIPFSPDYIFQMMPEHTYRPLIAGISTLLETMGFFGDTTQGGTVDRSGQLGNALAQAFTPMLPPAINIALYATTGAQVDLGARMTGRGNVLRTPNDPERPHIPIREGSEITNMVLEAAGIIAGNVGGDLIHALDTGLDIYSDQDDLVEATIHGGREFAQRSSRTSAQPIPFGTGPLANQHANNKYQSNAVSQRGFELREVFRLVNGGTERGILRKPVDVEEPTLNTVTHYLRTWARSPQSKAFSERYKELSEKLKRIDTVRNVDFNTRSKARQNVLEQLNNFQMDQNRWMVQIEEDMKNLRGPQGMPIEQEYQQMYGEDLSFETLKDRLVKMRRKQ